MLLSCKMLPEVLDARPPTLCLASSSSSRWEAAGETAESVVPPPGPGAGSKQEECTLRWHQAQCQPTSPKRAEHLRLHTAHGLREGWVPLTQWCGGRSGWREDVAAIFLAAAVAAAAWERFERVFLGLEADLLFSVCFVSVSKNRGLQFLEA